MIDPHRDLCHVDHDTEVKSVHNNAQFVSSIDTSRFLQTDLALLNAKEVPSKEERADMIAMSAESCIPSCIFYPKVEIV